MLDKLGYRHTLRLCSYYFFSTPTMVKRMRFYDKLFVYCLSCLVVCQFSSW